MTSMLEALDTAETKRHRTHAELSAALTPIEIEVAQFDGWADGERIETLTLGDLRRLIRAAEAVLR